MPSPPPAPQQVPDRPAVDVDAVWHSVWHGIWLAVTSSPWSAAGFSLVVLGAVVSVFRFFRWLPVAAGGRVPVRLFVGNDRASILSWAGNRCEFHGWIFGRCKETMNLHVDHVHPHSRGGSTSVGNSQVLCSRHNKEKAARIPYSWQLRRLEKHRRGYFPAGVSGMVIRREQINRTRSKRPRQGSNLRPSA